MFGSKKSSPGSSKPLRHSTKRREEVRRLLPRPNLTLSALIQRPELINTSLILLLFLAMVSVVTIWSREQVKVRDGQVMNHTRVKRLDYQVEDKDATETLIKEARETSPRIYTINTSYLERLGKALRDVPQAVAGKTELGEIIQEIRAEYDLTEADLVALQSVLANEAATQQWLAAVEKLVTDRLPNQPLLRSAEFQNFTRAFKPVLKQGEQLVPLSKSWVIELRTESGQTADPRLREMVIQAGFSGPLAGLVVKRILIDAQPTILFSEEETTRIADAAVAAVQPVFEKHQRGELLYKRGDVLTPEHTAAVMTEAEQYRNSPATRWERWKTRLGTVGLIAIVSLFLGSFATIAYPKIVRNPVRIAAICTLMATLLLATAAVTIYAPIFLLPAAIGPVLFVAIILLVAYDQRLALLLSGLQCMLVGLALEQGIGFFILLIAGCATMVAQLRELRHRNSLIRAATTTAAVTGLGTALLSLHELPMVTGMGEQMLIMAFSAVGTSYGVAFLVLGILPSIEKLFDITTGMTLAELRDPKRPLLRQLQTRAPGTYTHSIQMANIAEGAADAIGADSLLVYVGALYHDIGKINKPEYFVENQSSGVNKHDKLSPAMSLLVIIGHVKNGVEMAREYGLPRPIIHFIESHHGTTLVEYFYHAARERAELAEDPSVVAEVEYRYPGPKPRTKEAAILMLADAVESATRAIAEPTPSRIENLVRRLGQKRLEDGQFDECDLTFKELTLIEDAMISRLLSIHHSRISYPSTAIMADDAEEESDSEQPTPIKAASA